ncbi:MAG: L-threonine 3-dehydrogenase [Gammaproteobacteria bacterium]
MKALIKAKSEPGIWMQDVAMPDIGPRDVLVKVSKTAICGTDMHIYHWDQWARDTIPVPMVTGHEFSGMIVDTGSSANKYKTGQRVSGEGHIVCGVCRNCRAGRGQLCRNSIGIGVHRQGAFAEYLCIPEHNIFALPDGISDEVAAIFDPFGNAVHTALTYGLVGEDVLITGAGTIGIMAAMVAQAVGARQVVLTDINPTRLEIAKGLGIDLVYNTAEQSLSDVMQELDIVEGFDIGLEMSGAPPAFREMIECMNTGGKIAILGIASEPFDVDWNKVVFKMLTLKGIYGREMFETWYKMAILAQTRIDLARMITHRLPADEFQQGFEIMAQGQCGKVVLDWNEI